MAFAACPLPHAVGRVLPHGFDDVRPSVINPCVLGQVYKSYTDHGFVPLSYFNLNHFGKDLVVPPSGWPAIHDSAIGSPQARRTGTANTVTTPVGAARPSMTQPVAPPGGVGPWWNDSATVLQRLFPRAPVMYSTMTSTSIQTVTFRSLPPTPLHSCDSCDQAGGALVRVFARADPCAFRWAVLKFRKIVASGTGGRRSRAS